MSQVLKRLAARTISEAYGALRRPTPPRPGLRTLMYHSVAGPKLVDGGPHCRVKAGAFKEQMELLARERGRDIVSLWPISEGMNSRPLVGVSFDDGYADNLTVAAPILRRVGIPFSVFVVPRFIQEGRPGYLSLGQLKDLACVPGCTIGSHGMTHRRMAGLVDKELGAELNDSRSWLEEKLGKPVKALAYPYGSADRRVRDAAAKAGYELGFCSQSGLSDGRRDPLLLRRTEISGRDSMRSFRLKLSGAWDWHALRHRDPQAS